MIKKPVLGAHVSVAGGYHHAFENATNIGAEAIQIFGASPRQWVAVLPSQGKINQWQTARAQNTVQTVFLHAAYLVNLASTNAEIRKKSIDSLTAHLTIAKILDADGLIFHMGSTEAASRTQGLQTTATGIQEVLRQVSGTTRLIMENSSGGGGKLCSDAPELAEILHMVKDSRLKVCFDTAHAFEAGIMREYSTQEIDAVFGIWEALLGKNIIVVFHINDSKTPCGSKSDRHENLGKGHIGLKGFKNLAKEPRIQNTSWLLEVPGFDNNGPDKRNMDIVKSLFE